MGEPRLRAAFAAFLIALAASLVAASPALDPLRGLSIDILTALRRRIYGNSQPPESFAVVVVALDDETFRTPPFDGTGRRQAVRIFEPLGVAGQLAPELLSRAQAYGAGLTRYRARDFAGAAEKFALVANDDPPSVLFLERARQLAQQPPGADWEAVSAQEEK